jgi:streptogramin lyase
VDREEGELAMNRTWTRAFFKFSGVALVALLLGAMLPLAVHAASDGILLTGTVKSAAGAKMSGVTVSAKMDNSTITTSVFTDDDGAYYFPPMAAGHYEVWAQADGFENGRGDVSLAATKHEDLVLNPAKDYVRQLSGDQILASLPDQTPDDRRLKRVFRNSCTSCHQPNYILQNKFDEQGWTAILETMKRVNVFGGYMGDKSPIAAPIDFHENELAAYLSRARGPEPSTMKLQLRRRPSGDAARVVFTEYDVPLFAANDAPKKYVLNNGSDWLMGTPSSLWGQHGVHDAQADLDGNIWFSVNVPNPYASLGRVDAKTGETKFFRVDGEHGTAANGHGAMRDAKGHIWFNIAPGEANGPGRMIEVDPAAQTLQVYTPPKTMEGPTFVAGTVDVDSKGKIWASTFHGASRFDPVTKEFTEYKSPTFKNSDGIGNTYGLTADGDGNGWWAEMNLDLVAKTDLETGKVSEIKIPEAPGVRAMFTPEEVKMYEAAGSTWNTSMPWAEGPRRMGADKQGHVVWVCDWWGGNLAKIDTRTLGVTLIPLPNPESQEPYQAAVDKDHNVWINLMNSDEVMKYDPKSSKWTEYPFPTLGAETRYISLLERDGKMEVILPYSRARRVARMTFRSREDIQALKHQVQQQEQARVQ